MTGPSASLETDEIASPSILPISVSISLIWLSALAPVGPMKTAFTLSAAPAFWTPDLMNGANSLETS